ncbi:MAG: heavy-metal-associated domain-containing protein [Hydrogenophilales bacterium]|nr:heavy-metal-associated domain-containing protein [Hydrogenophilales bacterium]
MEHLKLTVTGMSCMGCVNSVKNLLGALPGVGQIDIDLASGQVEVEYSADQIQPTQLRLAIEDGGYGVA